MSAGPYYTGTPLAKTALLTTGDNSRTAPTQAQTIFDPAAFGSGAGAVQRLTVTPVATLVASLIRIFLHDGTTFHLLFEIPIAAQTVSAGSAVSVVEQSAALVSYMNRYPIMIPTGWTLKASVNDTQTGVNVTAQGGAG